MSTDTPIRLKVPEQDLGTLSLFEPKVEAARSWASHLPIANPGSVVQQLVSALSEINRCRMAPELRFNILRALQDNLDSANLELSSQEVEELDALTAPPIVCFLSVAVLSFEKRTEAAQLMFPQGSTPPPLPYRFLSQKLSGIFSVRTSPNVRSCGVLRIRIGLAYPIAQHSLTIS